MPVLPTVEIVVTDPPAAEPPSALAHFQGLLTYETDCWDIHAALAARQVGFVVLDVRTQEAFASGHVPGAVNLPYRRLVERNLAAYSADMLFVVYCSGPHCNGADKAAVALARLGRRVKKMIGGIAGWQAEGFEIATGSH
jgi:rhodanese-related sulfurtransferase